MTATKSKLAAGALALALIAAAVAVKMVFYPSVKDEYFTLNQRSLRDVPFGLVVLRPTHFPKSARTGVMWGSEPRPGKPVRRVMGRNVSLQELFATAYGKNADRVLLPPDAPKTNFDFLVTAAGDQQQRLQTAIRRRLGLVAKTEMREAEVLALTVNDPNLPRLTVSDAKAGQKVDFNNGKLQFTHIGIQDLMRGLEQVLKVPVVDKTSLTNYYDFSVAWGPQMQRQLQNDATATAAVKKILDDLGLALESDHDQTEMLVVKSGT
ncbi:MAG TPA: TIGR03435 family protein [Candidatus Acidoferrales bacterium]|nr:TIGR03435 family protein [Candidatus Acidoferrales bacterium]